MIYELPIDLYKEWKDLAYTKELFENIVKELKESKSVERMLKGGEWK